MQILRKTSIDFLGKRPIAAFLSAVLLAVAIWSLVGGVNKGIDFTGGTEIQVKFAEPISIDLLREGLADHDIDASLQTIGAPGDNEFLIRVGGEQGISTVHADEKPATVTMAQAQDDMSNAASAQQVDDDQPSTDGATGASSDGDGASSAAGDAHPAPESSVVPTGASSRVYQQVLQALRDLTGTAGETRLDLNIANEQEIAALLAGGPEGAGPAATRAAAIVAYRTAHAGLFRAYDEINAVSGMTTSTMEFLRSDAVLGPLTIRKVDFVGPRVGRELADKAMLAMVFALVGMLVYITVRFHNLGYALGGIVALVHDGVIAAGVFNLWGGQFDLTIVAALLTLLGYSINDTIVIFDRVRENTAAMRGIDREQVFNDSINQTLSRTLLTSLTTLLVVACLYFFGGETIHGFAFLLLFGIIIGTYSTIFVASPVAILYQHWSGRRQPGGKVRAAAVSRKSSSRRRSA